MTGPPPDLWATRPPDGPRSVPDGVFGVGTGDAADRPTMGGMPAVVRAPAAPCGSAERSIRASGVGALPGTQAFVDRAGGEHIGIAVATADQLHADRQPVDLPGGNGGGRMAGAVDDIGEAPTDERVDVDALDVPRADRVAVLGVVDGRRREGRGHQQVMGA